MLRHSTCVFAFFLLASVMLIAGGQPTVTNRLSVPAMVNINGILTDATGAPVTSLVGVTFCLYNESRGGAPLWMETQNVRADKGGHYTVMLGSATKNGLPSNLFASGQARWLGVQAQGQQEQSRILLVSVPYALKALDAETIGGKPASAFMLASHADDAGTTVKAESNNPASNNHGVVPAVGGSGTPGYLAEWSSQTKLGNSGLFQTTSGDIGLSTTTPTQHFEVDSGNLLVAGPDNFKREGDTAFLYIGDANHFIEPFRNSKAGGMLLGVFKAPQALFLQDYSGRIGVNTITPAVNFDVNGAANIRNTLTLFSSGGQPVLAVNGTGFGVNSSGQVSFVNGQTFPGTGTVTSVGTGLGLVGGTITHTGTISIDTSVVPRLTSSNTFTAQQQLNAGLLAGGTIQAMDGSFPLLMNSLSCCTSGSRMIWAHDPSYATWGIYYDDSKDIMHWQQTTGVDMMTLNFNNGNVSIAGNLTKGGGSFKIDDPLDPTNKYLYHSFVESPDMMNIYNGVVTLDSRGRARITMPDYFEALNRDFRYQLTSIGRSQPGLYVGKEIAGNQFEIAGGKPGGKVSWQVTGIRHDVYANAYRIPVEEEKPPKEQGHYLYPALYEQPQVASTEPARP